MKGTALNLFFKMYILTLFNTFHLKSYKPFGDKRKKIFHLATYVNHIYFHNLLIEIIFSRYFNNYSYFERFQGNNFCNF